MGVRMGQISGPIGPRNTGKTGHGKMEAVLQKHNRMHSLLADRDVNCPFTNTAVTRVTRRPPPWYIAGRRTKNRTVAIVAARMSSA